MFSISFILLFCVHNGWSKLWPKGVVHFAINMKDYDVHSQDIILSTLVDLERETCVKFFNLPADFNSTGHTILYISNPDKRKECPPDKYDFDKPVVDMPIGYKCLNKKNISRIVIDMLRASIEKSDKPISSFDLVRKFQEEQEDPSRPSLMNPVDRNYINLHYHRECRSLAPRAPPAALRANMALSVENERFYRDKLWPLGVVMYGVDPDLVNSPAYSHVKEAMTAIEMASCVRFKPVEPPGAKAENLLWFQKTGNSEPALGFKKGNQSISLARMAEGAAGHAAHTVGLLMRALGVPMVSNRPDRDSYVNIHWNNVEKGKEHFLEQYPVQGWLRDARLPYDFDSVTHAPANFACRDCSRGQMTVEPVHDSLWRRALSMGHHMELSSGDRTMLDMLYAELCRHRYDTINKSNK